MSRKFKDYPGYMRRTKAAGISGWSPRSIGEAGELGLYKDSFKDSKTGVLYISEKDVDDLKWLVDHHKKSLHNLRNIDELRAQESEAVSTNINGNLNANFYDHFINGRTLEKVRHQYYQYRLGDDPSKKFDLIEAYEEAVDAMSYLLRTLQELLNDRPGVA